MTMTVARNEQFNGIEVTFDKRPSRTTLDTLKSHGFRWHREKRLWYAKDNAVRRTMLEKLEKGVTVAKTKASKEKNVVINKQGVKVGDIFILTFGYDMTLYDFFQVVSVTENSCRVVEVVLPCTHGDFMNPRFQGELGKKYPRKPSSMWIKDQAKGDIKRTQEWNGHVHITIGEHWATPYDGREVEEDHWD